MYNFIQTIQVDQPSFFVKDLFLNSFGVNPPTYPKHFILFAKGDHGAVYPIGYTNFLYHQEVYLGGGMCIDSHLLRRLPKSVLSELRQAGGVAHFMLNSAIQQLNDCIAIFGYVGNAMAERVDFAVGFVATEYPHVIVYWKQSLPPTQQQILIDKIAQLGPF